MKAGNSEKAGVLRMLVAAVKNKEIEKRGKGGEPILTNDEIVDVLSREAKKRRESIEVYKQGGREELAQKESAELAIIQQYLPEQLSEQEIEKIIDEAIAKTGANSIGDLGKVMGEVTKQIRGKADGKLVSEIVKRKLQ